MNLIQDRGVERDRYRRWVQSKVLLAWVVRGLAVIGKEGRHEKCRGLPVDKRNRRVEMDIEAKILVGKHLSRCTKSKNRLRLVCRTAHPLYAFPSLPNNLK
jgi:hypothetical protein